MNKFAEKFTDRLSRLVPFGKNEPDPLTSLKLATRWAENLPIGDTFKAQQTILAEIKRLNENATDHTKTRLDVLMLLDEKAQDLQDTLVQQYLRNPRMSRSVESQLWHGIHSLYWETARAYYGFVLAFTKTAGRKPYDDQIPLVTLRAIRGFGRLLKWRAVRYLQPAEKLWLRLHNLYRVAASEGFHQRRQQAYPGEDFESSCESSYQHILMLSLASSGTLYPRQLHLVDRWLCNWHEFLSLETHLDIQRHSFVVDLAADHGPRRVRNPADDKPLRFWGTAPLVGELERIQSALRAGTPPAQLGLTEDARTAESIDLIDHLKNQWSALASREQRRSPREPRKRLVEVTHGLSRIIDQVKTTTRRPEATPYGQLLPYEEAEDIQIYGFVTQQTRERTTMMRGPAAATVPDVERWVMHDESDVGYGATVETRDKDWLRVGTLVAAKPAESEAWRLGVIRRLARVSEASSAVGIETFPGAPTVVMLRDGAASSGYIVDGVDHAGAQLPVASLWVQTADDAGVLVMDPAFFATGKVVEVQGVPDIRFLLLNKPLERGEGWIRVDAQAVQT